MVGDGNCDCRGSDLLLHDDVATALTNVLKTVLRKDLADLLA